MVANTKSRTQNQPDLMQRLDKIEEAIKALHQQIEDSQKVFLKVSEVGKRIGYSTTAVHELIHRQDWKRLPAVQLTPKGQWLIPVEALQQWARELWQNEDHPA